MSSKREDKMENSTWQSLLKSALETEDIEIDCGECFDLLDMYAEFIMTEGLPEDIMPAVEQHLKQCNCCAGELKALMVMLDEAASQEEDKD